MRRCYLQFPSAGDEDGWSGHQSSPARTVQPRSGFVVAMRMPTRAFPLLQPAADRVALARQSLSSVTRSVVSKSRAAGCRSITQPCLRANWNNRRDCGGLGVAWSLPFFIRREQMFDNGHEQGHDHSMGVQRFRVRRYFADLRIRFPSGIDDFGAMSLICLRYLPKNSSSDGSLKKSWTAAMPVAGAIQSVPSRPRRKTGREATDAGFRPRPAPVFRQL